MKKFNIYDDVALRNDLDDYELLEGEEGMVMGCKEYDDGHIDYAIQFPFDDDILHDCEGLVPSGRGLFLPPKELELI